MELDYENIGDELMVLINQKQESIHKQVERLMGKKPKLSYQDCFNLLIVIELSVLQYRANNKM